MTTKLADDNATANMNVAAADARNCESAPYEITVPVMLPTFADPRPTIDVFWYATMNLDVDGKAVTETLGFPGNDGANAASAPNAMVVPVTVATFYLPVPNVLFLYATTNFVADIASAEREKRVLETICASVPYAILVPVTVPILDLPIALPLGYTAAKVVAESLTRSIWSDMLPDTIGTSAPNVIAFPVTVPTFVLPCDEIRYATTNTVDESDTTAAVSVEDTLKIVSASNGAIVSPVTPSNPKDTLPAAKDDVPVQACAFSDSVESSNGW